MLDAHRVALFEPLSLEDEDLADLLVGVKAFTALFEGADAPRSIVVLGGTVGNGFRDRLLTRGIDVSVHAASIASEVVEPATDSAFAHGGIRASEGRPLQQFLSEPVRRGHPRTGGGESDETRLAVRRTLGRGTRGGQ